MTDDWQYCFPIIPKILQDGDRTRWWRAEILMRKRDNDRWIYRRPTPEEEKKYLSREAW